MLTSGSHLENGECIFFLPKYNPTLDPLCLVHGEINGETLALMETELDGKKTILALQKIDGKGNTYAESYCSYRGSLSPEEIVLSSDSHCILKVLKNPSSGIFIDKTKIVKALFQEVNTSLLLKIFHAGELSDLLELAGMLKVPVNFRTPIGRAILNTTVKSDANEEFLHGILKLDPQALCQASSSSKSFYCQAVLHQAKKIATLVLRITQENSVNLTEADRWLQRASNNDLLFEEKEFTALPPKLQRYIYKVANLYDHESFVSKLNKLGMLQDTFYINRISGLAPNMDIVTIRDRIWSYLRTLRSQGRLLTYSEYKERYPRIGAEAYSELKRRHQMNLDANGFTNRGITLEGNGFVDKTKNNFSLLLGTDYIQRIIDKHDFQYPKTPYTLAVISPGIQSNVSMDIIDSKGGIYFDSRDFYIKAEYIPADSTYVPTFQETKEFVQVVENTTYTDLQDFNIFLTPTGAYFIDTEVRNFNGMDCDTQGLLLNGFRIRDKESKAYVMQRRRYAPEELFLPHDERSRMLKNVGIRRTGSYSLQFPIIDLLAIAPPSIDLIYAKIVSMKASLEHPPQIRRMANLCTLDKIIGMLKEEKTDEALKMFKELSTATKNAIYAELYKIVSFQNDYYPCAEHAFWGLHGQNTSNEKRSEAIMNFVYRASGS